MMKKSLTLVVNFDETPFLEIPDAIQRILDAAREYASVEKAELRIGSEVVEDVS